MIVRICLVFIVCYYGYIEFVIGICLLKIKEICVE